MRREDTRNCQDCHQPGIVARARRRPNYDGIDLSRMTSMESANMTWDFFKRVRDITRMKILVKGAPPSTPCRRSSKPCAAASRYWSTADSGAALTS